MRRENDICRLDNLIRPPPLRDPTVGAAAPTEPAPGVEDEDDRTTPAVDSHPQEEAGETWDHEPSTISIPPWPAGVPFPWPSRDDELSTPSALTDAADDSIIVDAVEEEQQDEPVAEWSSGKGTTRRLTGRDNAS